MIILLDGNPAVGYHSAFPLLARRFNRAGFNVATLVAPYHLQRRPRRPIEWNCLEFARAIAQNVAEILALTRFLRHEACVVKRSNSPDSFRIKSITSIGNYQYRQWPSYETGDEGKL